MKIELTEFSKRHFDKDFSGTKILITPPEQLISVVNSLVDNYDINNLPSGFGDANFKIMDGYADFCKLLVVSNFTDAKTGTVPISPEISSHIKTKYVSRTDQELPVLTRWLELPSESIPIAEYLVLVLYSREQLRKESGDKVYTELDIDTDYGVVAILGQMTPEEEPMKPITMMRNSLGISEGGSGVPLDREQYMRSVEFWSNNITIK